MKKKFNLNAVPFFNSHTRAIHLNLFVYFKNTKSLRNRNDFKLETFNYIKKVNTVKIFINNSIFVKVKKLLHRPVRIFDRRVMYNFSKLKLKYRKFIRSRFNIKEFINPYLLNSKNKHLVEKCERKVLSNLKKFYSKKRSSRAIVSFSKPSTRAFYTRNYKINNKLYFPSIKRGNKLLFNKNNTQLIKKRPINFKIKINKKSSLKVYRNKNHFLHLLRILRPINFIKFFRRKTNKNSRVLTKSLKKKVKLRRTVHLIRVLNSFFPKEKLNKKDYKSRYKLLRSSKLKRKTKMLFLLAKLKKRTRIVPSAKKIVNLFITRLKKKNSKSNYKLIFRKRFLKNLNELKSNVPFFFKRYFNNKEANPFMFNKGKNFFNNSKFIKKAHTFTLKRDNSIAYLNKQITNNRKSFIHLQKSKRTFNLPKAVRRRKLSTNNLNFLRNLNKLSQLERKRVILLRKNKKKEKTTESKRILKLYKAKKYSRFYKFLTFAKFYQNNKFKKIIDKKKKKFPFIFGKPFLPYLNPYKNMYFQQKKQKIWRIRHFAVKKLLRKNRRRFRKLKKTAFTKISFSFFNLRQKRFYLKPRFVKIKRPKVLLKPAAAYGMFLSYRKRKSFVNSRLNSSINNNSSKINNTKEKILSGYPIFFTSPLLRSIFKLRYYFFLKRYVNLKDSTHVKNALNLSKYIKERSADHKKVSDLFYRFERKTKAVNRKLLFQNRNLFLSKKFKNKALVSKLKNQSRINYLISFGDKFNNWNDRFSFLQRKKQFKTKHKSLKNLISFSKLKPNIYDLRNFSVSKNKLPKNKNYSPCRRFDKHIYVKIKANRKKEKFKAYLFRIFQMSRLFSLLLKYRTYITFFKKKRKIINSLNNKYNIKSIKNINSGRVLRLLKLLNTKYFINAQKLLRRYWGVRTLYKMRFSVIKKLCGMKIPHLFASKHNKMRKKHKNRIYIRRNNINHNFDVFFKRHEIYNLYEKKQKLFSNILSNRNSKAKFFIDSLSKHETTKHLKSVKNIKFIRLNFAYKKILNKKKFNNIIKLKRYSNIIKNLNNKSIKNDSDKSKIFLSFVYRNYRTIPRSIKRRNRKNRSLSNFKRFISNYYFKINAKKLKYKPVLFKKTNNFIKVYDNSKVKTIKNKIKRKIDSVLIRNSYNFYSNSKRLKKEKDKNTFKFKLLSRKKTVGLHNNLNSSNLSILKSRVRENKNYYKKLRKYKVRKELLSNSVVLRSFFLPLLSFEKHSDRFGEIKIFTRVRFSKRILLTLKKIKTILKYYWKTNIASKRSQKILPFDFRRKPYVYHNRYIAFNNKRKNFDALTRLFNKTNYILKKKTEAKKLKYTDYAIMKADFEQNKKVISVDEYRNLRRKFLRLTVINQKKKSILSSLPKKKAKRFNKNIKLPRGYFDVRNPSKVFYHYSFNKFYHSMQADLKRPSIPHYRSFMSNKEYFLKSARFEKFAQKKSYDNLKLPYKRGSIIVRFKKNNLFMCLVTKKNKVVAKTSAGQVDDFKGGKARSTAYSKSRVATVFSQKSFSLNYKLVDIVLKDFKRKYNYQLAKGFSKSKLFVRLLTLQQKISHGYRRLKKPRRV